MATSLSTTSIPLTGTRLRSRSERRFPIHFPTQRDPSVYSSLQSSSMKRLALLAPTESLTSKMESLTSFEFEVNDEVDRRRRGREENEVEEEEKLADRWREIHGEDDWVGLLDPIDPILRSELVRYGEMAQACYDAFDYDRHSVNCGSCKYTKAEFFKGLEMDHGYDVTRYLFATSNINLMKFFKKSTWPDVWSRKANWIGYVAVSNDETTRRLGRRDITVAWRGTVTQLEWLHDLMDILKPVSSDKIPCHDREVKVESGFVSLYTDKDPDCSYCELSAREQVLGEVARLVELHRAEDVSITLTGHSLGSALAVLSAFDIAETGANIRQDGRETPMTVFSFSGPRVGNTRFKERLENTLGVKVLRVHNVNDMVPTAPGLIVNEHLSPTLAKMAEGFPWSYSHVGTELALDHKNSPFLKDTHDGACAHNLEALLHLIDGYHGKGEHFRLASKRDIALVNKACDFLKAHHQIPPCWRQDKNKGMTRGKDGRWIQPDRPMHEDLHHHDMQRHLRRLGLADS